MNGSGHLSEDFGRQLSVIYSKLSAIMIDTLLIVSSLLGGNFHLEVFPTILQSFFIHKQRYALHEWSSTVINFFPTAQPIYLCPVDLHKLQHLCGFDIVDRYRQVLSWLLFLFISFECRLKCETVLTWSLINFRVLLIFLCVLLCYYTGV